MAIGAFRHQAASMAVDVQLRVRGRQTPEPDAICPGVKLWIQMLFAEFAHYGAAVRSRR